MRQSQLYFIAAALFFVAGALNTFNEEGFTVMTGAGIVIGCAMLVLGFNMRKAGK